ncbi:properdin [Larimichthys crocea]|uniref:properdin n=1 Tax=Larimichthys crocea TaxID=215358 RepID=UPI00090091A4|nr:properdin [Larimichthys crocea]
MEVLTGRRVLLVLILMVSVERSECVRCFARFNLTLGQCDEEIGEVDEDDCFQNPHYGYKAADGVCRSCGPPVWSPWSLWSQCNILCGRGVTQRRRTCFGIGQCESGATLETRPCNGSCCDGEGWGLWLSWSPCSVTCGALSGVRKRERVCSSLPECRSACSGPSEETERCQTSTTCPVHGAWSDWSGWSECSASCIRDHGGAAVPSKTRSRSCSNPAPSNDTVPPGKGCPGDDLQTEPCSELPNCPVDGSWGAWPPPGPCSVTCGEGLRLSIRICNRPAPKYGGRPCEGPSTQSSVCQSPCPVDGFWTGWSSWSECSSTCISQGQPPIRTRYRTCSNPAPSPSGQGCQGDDRQTDNCNHLPYCPVDGSWGSWSPYSSCPVTCGVGLQVSNRRCDSPAPIHAGLPCPGEGRRTTICRTNVHCPVDGMWSEWSAWSKCEYPFSKKDISCKTVRGRQTRSHECLHRAHNGSICSGHGLTETRACYNVDKCDMKGTWQGWKPWTLCKPACGHGSKRHRLRHCEPDFSSYRSGRYEVELFGKPITDCGPTPDGGKPFEIESCDNVPPCP